jgi:hypothetical protein
MNQDGIDDIGLWMPARDGITPRGQSEWYFLVSGVTQNDTQPYVPAHLGPTIPGSGDPTPGSYLANPALYGLANYTNGRIVTDPLTPGQNIVRFQPVPFGNDLYMQFGDEFALPLVGNFDPPITGSTTGGSTNPRDQHDVTNDGTVNTLDILAIVNYLTEHGAGAAPTGGFVSAPFCDVTGDSLVNTLDLLAVVNHISAQYAIANGDAEGEGHDDFFTSLGSGESDEDDLLGLLSDGR